ncbi:hypothetical protein LIX31_02920 [Leptospira kirschneri]|nr:hypothetical protein [Leptospira kirschneri]EJO71258.1 hypothetical protein LEP1GSC044_3980 [Leptospira kirschneri serovar Grippotyphosa str. RM52]WBF94991.1 hypothetical protein LIX31_02920 [Leptospira kirschneri]
MKHCFSGAIVACCLSSFSSLKGEKEQAKANPDCIQFRQNPIYFSLNSL